MTNNEERLFWGIWGFEVGEPGRGGSENPVGEVGNPGPWGRPGNLKEPGEPSRERGHRDARRHAEPRQPGQPWQGLPEDVALGIQFKPLYGQSLIGKIWVQTMRNYRCSFFVAHSYAKKHTCLEACVTDCRTAETQLWRMMMV